MSIKLNEQLTFDAEAMKKKIASLEQRVTNLSSSETNE
jgi:hypothetical protein